MAKRRAAAIEESLSLLQDFLYDHGPGGQEDEVRARVRAEWSAAGLDVREDDAGNLYARLGRPGGAGPRVAVMSHMDEIGMLVTGLEEDGRLKVANLGGASPWKYGEGPVDVLLPGQGNAALEPGQRTPTLRAVLSVGSTHTAQGPLGELKAKRALTWDLVRLDTGLDARSLRRRGVDIGCRAVVARERKKLERLGTGRAARIACFAIDDRSGLTVLALVARRLAKARLPGEVWLGATVLEESGCLGSVRLCRRLGPEVALAVDTSPSVPEMPLRLDGSPSLWLREGGAVHSMKEAARFDRAAARRKLALQRAVYPSAGSDAGAVQRAGAAGRTLVLGVPRDNSHGFELAHPAVMVNTAEVLATYLESA